MSPLPDSNRQPRDYKSRALPIVAKGAGASFLGGKLHPTFVVSLTALLELHILRRILILWLFTYHVHRLLRVSGLELYTLLLTLFRVVLIGTTVTELSDFLTVSDGRWLIVT